MNWEILTNSNLVENLGWTLAHSIWQIGLIWLVLFFVLRILQRFSANARYAAAVSALALAALLPIFTFVQTREDFSAKHFRIENRKNVSAGQLNKKMPPPETLPDFTGAENTIITAESNKFSSLIEDVRRFFNENFSALLPFIVGVWFFGVMFFSVRLTGGAWQLHVYKTREIIEPSDEWKQRFSAVCEKLQIKQSVVFLQSNLIETPIAIGFLKPFILIPASVFCKSVRRSSKPLSRTNSSTSAAATRLSISLNQSSKFCFFITRAFGRCRRRFAASESLRQTKRSSKQWKIRTSFTPARWQI
jgi:beta-lactamase regulating signal transducer with metallopeptidase domain